MTKRVQDRYRSGTRRTAGEPLAASWRPLEDAEPHRRRKRPKGVRGVFATYGWRVYAVPVLVAVTVLALMQTTGEDDADAGARTAASSEDGGAPADDPGTERGADVAEVPPKPIDLNIPTAELPPGADFLQAGAVEWAVLPGRTDRVGTGGQLFTYTIEVENPIDLAPYGGNDAFASLVMSTLGDPRGWASTGQVSLQRVDGDEEPDIRISLSTPETLHKPEYCGYSIKYESSCWRRSEKRVMINLARWVRGALAFNGDMGNYRSYAINHEIGHAFGKGHVGCANEGELAPVMMQQTFGTANNYVAQLNDQAGNDDPVAADGKTCRYNPWPNPQAQPPT